MWFRPEFSKWRYHHWLEQIATSRRRKKFDLEARRAPFLGLIFHDKMRSGTSLVFPSVHSPEHYCLKVLLERPGFHEQMSLGNIGFSKVKQNFPGPLIC